MKPSTTNHNHHHTQIAKPPPRHKSRQALRSGPDSLTHNSYNPNLGRVWAGPTPSTTHDQHHTDIPMKQSTTSPPIRSHCRSRPHAFRSKNCALLPSIKQPLDSSIHQANCIYNSSTSNTQATLSTKPKPLGCNAINPPEPLCLYIYYC